MKRIFPALLAAIIAVGCASAATPEPTAPTTSPVPAEQLPSVGVDGSALFTTNDNMRSELVLIDLATGETAASTTPLDLGNYSMLAQSDDGGQIALFNYPTASIPDDGVLQLIDTRTLGVTPVKGIQFPSMVNMLNFSPDAGRLVVTYLVNEKDTPDSPISEYHLALIDLARGAVAADVEIGFSPNILRWSPDGASISAYGVRYGSYENPVPETPDVILLDGADLHTLWSAKVEGLRDGNYPDKDAAPDAFYPNLMWNPASAFSADASQLYLVHADEDKLTTVDFARKSITSIDIGAKKTFLDTLMGLGAEVAHAKAIKGTNLTGVLSPDGTQLYVTGTHMDYTVIKSNDVEFTNTPLGLRVIDVASGALLRTVDVPGTRIGLSQDGARLFMVGYDDDGTAWTQVLDAVSLQPITIVPGYEVYPSVFTLKDGRKGLPAMRWGFNGGTTIAVVDVQTFEPLVSWESKESASWVMNQR